MGFKPILRLFTPIFLLSGIVICAHAETNYTVCVSSSALLPTTALVEEAAIYIFSADNQGQFFIPNLKTSSSDPTVFNSGSKYRMVVGDKGKSLEIEYKGTKIRANFNDVGPEYAWRSRYITWNFGIAFTCGPGRLVQVNTVPPYTR